MRFQQLLVLFAALLLTVTACGGGTTSTTAPGESATATTEAELPFPVTVETFAGPVTIDTMPTRIVSLSPTATETLFAIGAGDQVVAVDEYSYVPAEAPVTDLSSLFPNVEAILAHSPDLLVISENPDDLRASIEAVGIPVLLLGSAPTLNDAYSQIEQLGAATGHIAEAVAVVSDMQTRIAVVTSKVVPMDPPPTFYHELDTTLYSVTSETFIGQIYGLLGLENIADGADPDGFGFPQLSEEFIIESNPDFVFLADTQCCGVSADTVGARPGWKNMAAVDRDQVIEVDADIASRWGPSIADFIEAVAAAVDAIVNA